MLKSLKSKGKAAVILPHGVLFRGNAEAEIRKNLIKRGYIKGIIGLPANLFYGTGIPACLIVLDKENAGNRKALFMIDASKGFAKDGPKNRLRDQDIHKIVDVFNKQLELPKYSRIVPFSEVEEKEFNLNIPRYIDSQEAQDLQDIAAHLAGGLPDADITALQGYWDVYAGLKDALFAPLRPGYQQLRVGKETIKTTIFGHPAFATYQAQVEAVFAAWQGRTVPICKAINGDTKPKKLISILAEDLLEAFGNLRLIDKYDVYQHLMSYWSETMQDDAYLIVADGWKAGNTLDWDSKHKSFEGKLIPKALIVQRYFAAQRAEIDNLEVDRDAVAMQIEELEEEHGGDEGLLADARNDKDKVNAASVKARLKVIKGDQSAADEKAVLETYLELTEELSEANKKVKEAESKLTLLVIEKYSKLTEDEVKTLVVEDKWIATLAGGVRAEMQRISQRLTQRIKELAERYETPVPDLVDEVAALETRVKGHLERMGFVWN